MRTMSHEHDRPLFNVEIHYVLRRCKTCRCHNRQARFFDVVQSTLRLGIFAEAQRAQRFQSSHARLLQQTVAKQNSPRRSKYRQKFRSRSFRATASFSLFDCITTNRRISLLNDCDFDLSRLKLRFRIEHQRQDAVFKGCFQ